MKKGIPPDSSLDDGGVYCLVGDPVTDGIVITITSPRKVSQKVRSVKELYPKGEYPDCRERFLVLMNQPLKWRILSLLFEGYPFKVVYDVVVFYLFFPLFGERGRSG